MLKHNHERQKHFLERRIITPRTLFSMIYYQSNFEVKEESFPLRSENVFLGRGANPPKRPQNSPASASAINFPSSV
jgi:hypothetical protein